MNAKERIRARKNRKLAARKEHQNHEVQRYTSSETYPGYFEMTQGSGQAYINSVNSVHQQNSEGVDLNKHPSGIIPQLQNVVSTCYLGLKLDLKHIAMHANNAEYNPKRFAAVIMRIREPKTTALIFSSGKIVCTGARSEEDSRLASRKFAKIIQKLGFEKARFKEFQVQNIVASCDVHFPIRLEGLNYKHSLFCSYEPELFPGLIYRMKKPKVVLLIFVSGKVVLTGAKTRDEIYAVFEIIYPSLLQFRKGAGGIGGAAAVTSSGIIRELIKEGDKVIGGRRGTSAAAAVDGGGGGGGGGGPSITDYGSIHKIEGRIATATMTRTGKTKKERSEKTASMTADHEMQSYASELQNPQDMSRIMAHLRKSGLFFDEFDSHGLGPLPDLDCDDETDGHLLPIDLPLPPHPHKKNYEE